MENFIKIINPGVVKKGQLFCKIEYKKEVLSISGLIGPKKNGNCTGSCGQIYDDMKIINFTKEWSQKKLEKFIKVWKQWHLNDMNPNCEHQTIENGFNPEKEVNIYSYILNTEIWTKQNSIKKLIEKEIIENKKCEISEEMQNILKLPLSFETHIEKDYPFYRLKEVKTQRLAWLKSNEHPEGCLCKPCPICGYKYGTKWIKKEVPFDVLKWLQDLPETNINPAWI